MTKLYGADGKREKEPMIYQGKHSKHILVYYPDRHVFVPYRSYGDYKSRGQVPYANPAFLRKKHVDYVNKKEFHLISIVPTTECPKRCTYCYDALNRKKESPVSIQQYDDKRDQILDGLDDKERTFVIVYGGDPLVEDELLDHIYKDTKIGQRSLITGLGPDNYKDIATRWKKMGVAVSIDPPGDKYKRKNNNFEESYHETLERLTELDSLGRPIKHFRATLSPGSCDIEKLYQDLKKAIPGADMISINWEPASGKGKHWNLSEEDKAMFVKCLDLAWARTNISRGPLVRVYDKIKLLWSSDPFYAFSTGGCGGTHKTKSVISANDNRTFCHELDVDYNKDDAEWFYGDYESKKIFGENYKQLNDFFVKYAKMCQDCSYKYLCGMRCPVKQANPDKYNVEDICFIEMAEWDHVLEKMCDMPFEQMVAMCKTHTKKLKELAETDISAMSGNNQKPQTVNNDDAPSEDDVIMNLNKVEENCRVDQIK